MIGAVLAGGAGSRLGASGRGKAGCPLAGRPLAAYPVAALGGVCDRVAVVCKRNTELPKLGSVERWDEPDEPRHPLTGLTHALRQARAPLVVCAVDMPLVTPDACRSLLSTAARTGATATVAVAGERLQPLLGVYDPAALALLPSPSEGGRLTDAVEALRPARVELPERLVRSVNTPEDLAVVETALREDQRRSST